MSGDSNWYRAGTVTVTSGSDQVVGVGTTFIDNVLPGAIFFAPEGTYEVLRVVSDSEFLLAKPYAGANTVAAEYEIAPTQAAVISAVKALQSFNSDLGDLKAEWEAGDLNGKGLALKGTKNTIEDLPASGNAEGDGWMVDGVLYVWSGSSWTDQGQMVSSEAVVQARDAALGAKDDAQAARDAAADRAGEAVAARDAARASRVAIDDRIYPGIYTSPPISKPSTMACEEGDTCFIQTGDGKRKFAYINGAWSSEYVDGIALADADAAGMIGIADGGVLQDALLSIAISVSLANTNVDVAAELQERLDYAGTIFNLSTGRGVDVVFPAGRFRIDTILRLPNGVNAVGVGEATVLDVSATDGLTAIISVNTVGPQVRNLKILGSGRGVQPIYNVLDPANPVHCEMVASMLTPTGCGVVFAHVTRGLVLRVTVEQCGGTTGVAPNNGIAGIYLTWGCTFTRVTECTANYCRNGINEDNFFGQSPSHNKITFNTLMRCRFGIALDSDGNANDTLVQANTVGYCQQSGIDLNKAGYYRVTHNHVYGCGIETGNSGIFAYATANIPLLRVDISHNTCFGNVGHGIKIGPFAYYSNVSHNFCTDNGKHGISCQGIFRHNTVSHNLCQGNAYAGICLYTVVESVVTTGSATFSGSTVSMTGLTVKVQAGHEIRGSGVTSCRIQSITSQSEADGTMVGTVNYAQTVGPVAVTVYRDVGMINRTNTVSLNRTIQNKQRGILLDGASKIKLLGNTVSDNSQDGAGLYDGIALINGSYDNQINGNDVAGDMHRYGVAATDNASINNAWLNNDIDAGTLGRFGFANYNQKSWKNNGDEFLTVAGAPAGSWVFGFKAFNQGDGCYYTRISPGSWLIERANVSGASTRADVDVTISITSSPSQRFNSALTAARVVNLPAGGLPFDVLVYRTAAAAGTGTLTLMDLTTSTSVGALTVGQWAKAAWDAGTGAWVIVQRG